MQPAARRTAYLAGLVFAALIALGGVNRSRNEWVARCEAEGLSRAAIEESQAARERAHEDELNSMRQRVALLESDLARERELRGGAEARAAVSAKPVAELEAMKGELSRAYGRIGELERGGGVQELRDGGERLTARLERRHCILTVIATEQNEKIRTEIEPQPEVGNVADKPEIKTALLPATEERLVCGKVREVIKQVDDGRQRMGDGLNQGVDYVDPPQDPPLRDPEISGARLNQGVDYVDPETASEGTEQDRLVVIENDLKEEVFAKPLKR